MSIFEWMDELESLAKDYGLTMEAYKMARFPHYQDQWKPEYSDNASNLLWRVAGLLNAINWTTKPVIISSGWRPEGINATVGGAKKSYHLVGRAVDIVDDGSLAHRILSEPEILKEYYLWLENPSKTKGWIHLDTGDRMERAVRVFNP